MGVLLLMMLLMAAVAAKEAGAVKAGVVAVVNFSRYERKTELTSPTTGQGLAPFLAASYARAAPWLKRSLRMPD